MIVKWDEGALRRMLGPTQVLDLSVVDVDVSVTARLAKVVGQRRRIIQYL